jgi:hypothetical protein
MEANRAFRQCVHILVNQRIRAVEDLLRRTLRRHFPVGQNDDVIGNRKGLLELMRDEKTGQTPWCR